MAQHDQLDVLDLRGPAAPNLQLRDTKAREVKERSIGPCSQSPPGLTLSSDQGFGTLQGQERPGERTIAFSGRSESTSSSVSSIDGCCVVVLNQALTCES